MSNDTRTSLTVAFDEAESTQLCTIATERGITLQALLDEIIDRELRRLRQEEQGRH